MTYLIASALFVLAGYLTIVVTLNVICRCILAAPKGIVPNHSTGNLYLAAIFTFAGLAIIHLF